MEGPSLRIAKEQLGPFIGQCILSVTGNSKIGKERLDGLVIMDIFSWGKHLVLQFDTFALRIHFMLFGSYEATVDGKVVTGDYQRSYVPRLELKFNNGTLLLFNCSLKYIEDDQAKISYDFTTDIMSKEWSPDRASREVKKYPNGEVADVLLDQTVFSGVGNIIKNEVLSMAKVNPKTTINKLSAKKLKEIIALAYYYSEQFYQWRKKMVLRKHYTIYQKGNCPYCGGKVTKEKTGKRQRWSFFCPLCQKLK